MPMRQKTIKFCTVVFILFTFNNCFSQFNTLNTSKMEDNYSDLEVNILYQINFIRTLNKLNPLYTNQTLNHHSKIVGKKLQTKNIDTSINNTLLIYYNDSIPLNHPFIKDTFDLIGIHTLPHKYSCNLMVITLDKKREQIKWKDLDCPNFLKKKKRN